MACTRYLEGPSTADHRNRACLLLPCWEAGGQTGNLSLTALAHTAIHNGPR